MKLTNRQIIETYKYESAQERDTHSEEMVNKGWSVMANSLVKSGLIRRYAKRLEN